MLFSYMNIDIYTVFGILLIDLYFFYKKMNGQLAFKSGAATRNAIFIGVLNTNEKIIS